MSEINENKEKFEKTISEFEDIILKFEDILDMPKNDNAFLSIQAYQLGELLGGILVYLNFLNIIKEKIDINKNKELESKLKRMKRLTEELLNSLEDPEEEYNPLYLGIEYQGLEEMAEKIIKKLLNV